MLEIICLDDDLAVVNKPAGVSLLADRSGDRWFHATPDQGHPSHTRFRVLRADANNTCVLLNPLTGRTHQLRVNVSWIGHPIAGDNLYGNPGSPEQRADRLMLHAAHLKLPGYPPMKAAHRGFADDTPGQGPPA